MRILSSFFPVQCKNLITEFDSGYITAQINQMSDAIEIHPSDAIGKAKELLESCCKTILSAEGLLVDSKWNVQQLVQKTCAKLKLLPADIPPETKSELSIKKS